MKKIWKNAKNLILFDLWLQGTIFVWMTVAVGCVKQAEITSIKVPYPQVRS